jgi:hypothetical protein
VVGKRKGVNMSEYKKWVETELEEVTFYQYELENGDKIIYSVNEYGLVDCFVIYIKESNTIHKHLQEELSLLNVLYISSGEDIETLRSIMKLTYKEISTGDYSYLGRMID